MMRRTTTPTSYKTTKFEFLCIVDYQNVYIVIVLAKTNLRWKSEDTKCTPYERASWS